MSEDHVKWMRYALEEAEKALQENEIPVGAVIVHKNKIIGRGYNKVESLQDSTAHAEMIAISAAVAYLGQKWLTDCTLYVTLEPCAMCAGALVLSRIKNIVFGADDPKAGACGSVMNIARNEKLNHSIDIRSGILENECRLILKEFFVKMRERNRNSGQKTN
ncbi:tRNA adenosine(34) deaminase TadA [bacterium]|nr:tRNA adenosine(34) deaminase TadA [bacterium]